MMSDVPERRNNAFTERVTLYVVVIAAVGAFLVLLDPKIALDIQGQEIVLGGEGFSSELKGAVITIMLIGGWTAAISYWLSDTATGKKQQESISRIAEQSAPTSAAAVAAATGAPPPPAPTGPILADTVNVDAQTANVTEKEKS